MVTFVETRSIPARHLSIRVPWHDDGWRGTVCRHPRENAACLILPRIRENRNDVQQDAVAGRQWDELDAPQLPPCVTERAGFMAPFEFTRVAEHPYRLTSRNHAHFAPTLVTCPPYSAGCIPFRWMLSENAPKHAEEFGLRFHPELEEQARDVMGFSSSWVQDEHNQRALLDGFFDFVQPEHSLCFFYAKRTPLSDDPRRVIIGVGRVTGVGEVDPYRYAGDGQLRSVIWERTIKHSIRPTFEDGFLLPYQAILERMADNPDLDPEQYVAFAPDDHIGEFSYASEHVSHDAAIASLLTCSDTLRGIASLVPGPWEQIQTWIDARLGELWRLRGAYPGLGAALCAFGIPRGNLIAYDIASAIGELDDPWEALGQAFADPTLLSRDLGRFLEPSKRVTWEGLREERRQLLQLLARFDLTPEQATRFYVRSERERARIEVTDRELIENPYRLYELDRHVEKGISFSIVDRGMFPVETIRAAHPMPAPSVTADSTDARRVRAAAVLVLEQASAEGHTLQPETTLIQQIRELALEPRCSLTEDTLGVLSEQFTPLIVRANMASSEPAYQLARLEAAGTLIRRELSSRHGVRRHRFEEDWSAIVAAALPAQVDPDDEAELRAREEKAAALAELAAARISVLIGPAGTGKTTLLAMLAEIPRIKGGGVLLLAPTGKARVQLMRNTGQPAYTVAQYLLKHKRYLPETGQYLLIGEPKASGARTIVIDEASMLTEEQLAAVLDTFKGVERLILVGDPRQLPPIGSGRPFVDIVARLTPTDVDVAGSFPRVSPGYVELTVRRRQTDQGTPRDDLLLADWFSGQETGAGADEIWDLLETRAGSDTLRLVRWNDETEVHDRLLDILVEELGLADREDAATFEQSLGGVLFGDPARVYFRRGELTDAGGDSKIEAWQILSPVHGQAHGVTDLNRQIQRQFRSGTLDWARSWRSRIPKPFGPEQIVYGDKVINTRNQNRPYVYPHDDALAYVANGEIGLAIGEYRTDGEKPRRLHVEFSSQPTYRYSFSRQHDFREDGTAQLELAYAITVHKSQGSEFGTTIVVLPNPCRLLSRELLYTALTRQRDRVVILHQGDFALFKGFATPAASETARRLTNLFQAPQLIPIEDHFLEGNLIHHTRRGEAVRSKSEVIIADLLFSLDLDYEYEAKFIGTDSRVRYPDFTIDDAGTPVYWEHLGLLHDPAYQRRWQTKLAWYRTQGILPIDEGEGEHGILVTSRDDARGGISSSALERQVREVFRR